MTKKKEKFLDRIVQKDYNNELEKVLENKDFDEEVKSILLAIFYKIDVSYQDYRKVKRRVESKQEYTEKLIKNIENNCNTIKIAKPDSKEATKLGEKTFLVDSRNKKIVCYPVERKLLYSISKIGKQEKIIKSKYCIVNKTMSNLINIGNNINTVEPLRDFNGWSWLTIKKEIENINYNLIYQNLRILVGEQFLNSWIDNSEYLIDYYDEFQNVLTEKFGKNLAEDMILALEKISILLELQINPSYKKMLEEIQKENEKELEKFQNNQKFIENLTEDKRQLRKKIKQLEKILLSKENLESEYTKRNEELPIDKKIFSIKILEKQVKDEKNKLLEELDEKNGLLNPKKFIEVKAKLEKKQYLLKILEIKNKKKEIEKILEEIQKIFLECFLGFINIAETKEEIIDLICIFRYYNLLPFNEKIEIHENNKLQEKLEEIEETLLKKAIDYKIMKPLSEDIEENLKMLKTIFKSKIISMENIYVAVIKEKDKYYIEFSENNENSYEEKFEIENISKEKLSIKLNKKIKILD